MSEKGQQTQGDVDNAFRTGEVYDAPNDVLIEYLRVLNTGSIPNEMVRHRETNRCITINTLINLRFIKSVERSNTIYTWIVIVLAAMSLMLGALSLVASIIQIVNNF